jgi:hypothetical protein
MIQPRSSLADVFGFGQSDQILELRLRLQVQRGAFRKIVFGQLSRLAASNWQGRFDLLMHPQVPAMRVTREDQTHHRKETLVAGLTAVGPQVFGGVPQSFAERVKVDGLGHDSTKMCWTEN